MRPVVLFVVVVAISLATTPSIAGDEPVSAGDAFLPVLQAIQENRGACHEPSAGELARAKRDVVAAEQRLTARLAELPDGKTTSEGLGLPSISEELQRPTPDLAVLESAEATLHRNRPGAKGDDYQRLRGAMRHYVRLVRATMLPDLPERFTDWMDRLATACTQYSADRSAENLSLVAESYNWLLKHGQAIDVLTRVREQTVNSNHRMRFSALFLDRLVGQPVNRPLSSDENNNGAQVHVRGTLTGKLSSVLVPDETRGVIHIGFNGMGNSNITAYKGRATVRARGRTNISAVQPVYLTPAGFGAGPPRSAARHRTSNSTVSLSLRCRVLRSLLTRVAGKVVARQQAANDRKVAERTRRQVEEKLRAESARIVKQGNQTLNSFGVFTALGPNPSSRLRLRTTANYLEWLGRYAGDTQFASPTGPPVADRDHAVLFQVHESAVNNSPQLVAGRTVSEADFREVVFSTLGLVPSDDAEVVGRLPAMITFAEEDPLTVQIRDGQVMLRCRLAAIGDDAGVDQAGPYTVTTSYAAQLGPEGTKINRNASIAIEPAGSPDIEKLQRTLSHFFVAEASSGGSQPLAALLGGATLGVEQLELADGWLTLGLQLEEGADSD